MKFIRIIKCQLIYLKIVFNLTALNIQKPLYKFQSSNFSQAIHMKHDPSINFMYVYDLAHFASLREIMWKFHNLKF